MDSAAGWVTAIGSLGLGGIVVEFVRSWWVGRAEKAELKTKDDHVPAVNESLMLGNADTVIKQLMEHVRWQDLQLSDLRMKLTLRDQRLAELAEWTADPMRQRVKLQAEYRVESGDTGPAPTPA